MTPFNSTPPETEPRPDWPARVLSAVLLGLIAAMVVQAVVL